MVKRVETAYGTLSKQEFIKRCKEACPIEITMPQMKTFYDTFCHVLRESIKNGDSVSLYEIGVLQGLDRPARTGRNPATGETVDVKPNMHLKFKISPKIKAELKDIDPNKRKPKKFY